MSRSLVLGNGNILLCMNDRGELKDFYFPYVGLENHIGAGRVHKIGVWVDGSFGWFSDPEWRIFVDYDKDTLSSKIIAENNKLSLKLVFSDVVYNEKNIFIRNLSVENLSAKQRKVKIFFNQQFQISETLHADTAYYNPGEKAIIHYKGRRVFLISGRCEGAVFDDYTTGLFNIEGKEGTWRDAEDGTLAQNPIEHGSVDSTIGFTLDMPASSIRTINYWIAVGKTFRETVDLQKYILEKSPDHLSRTAEDFWRAWAKNASVSAEHLNEKIRTLLKKSLFIIRTHCDNNGGILASGDSENIQYGRDTYGYVWPRDGAFASMALDKAGYFDISRRFYSFVNDVITEDGYILHKYQPDRSLGSSWHPWIKGGKAELAIQEDETALPLIGLWEHYKKSRDLEFVENVYNSFIKNSANFFSSYRDKNTGLPAPSYDLWEEKFGISTFTSSAVYGALVSASEFAGVLGKDDDRKKWLTEAGIMKDAIIKNLFDKESGYFYKLINFENGALQADRTIDASSFYGIFRFGVLEANDAILAEAYSVLKEKVGKAPVGGLARYEGDKYFREKETNPPNPWFVTTLWLTQYNIAKAKSQADLSKALNDLMWVAEKALPSGILSEQIDPFTGKQLSVAPLTWSHAEFILTVIAYLEKSESFEKAGKMKVPDYR